MKEFKYAKISEAPTIEEIDKELKRLDKLANDYNNEQMAIKIFINSIYGACASVFFICYNPNLAEAITLQGQDIIKFSAKVLNKYFKELWPRDKELHKILGMTKIPIVVNDVAVYGDTDSVYCSFEEIWKDGDYQGTARELILAMYKHRLKDFLNKAYESYAKRWNTKNIQDFELETISASAILLAKKKYVLDLAWSSSGNVSYENQEKIKAKGVEIVQSSTPLFARKYLKDILKILFREKKQLILRDFVNELKKLKQEFIATEIDNVAFGSSIGEYEKGIANDKDRFEVLPHCPIHVRAAGYYNYLINKNPKLRKKYSLIKSGDKVKYYYAIAEGGCNVFAYLPGAFPYEIAPSVDTEVQFQKAFVEPINRFIDALGFQTLTSNLIISKQLF